jgi:deazaflavin-dependent oxidoreductase (nitroreductase family)
VLPPIDARFSRRRRSLTSFGTTFPLCYLTTTGRRTGESRTVPLLHVSDGDRIVLIASNWGRRRHPSWSLNLDADPAARLTVNGVERRFRARRATPDEYETYWRAAVDVWPGYDDYVARAGREIRMFVLDPVEG